MTKLRVLDLFSGIGGFSLGLERTGGFETVAFCEIEPYCRKVLSKHWPKVKQYDDVRTLTADQLNRDGIEPNAICGGFPCQDISASGKGAGIDGGRSGLWLEMGRLIREIRPRVVIVENVGALAFRGLGRVLGDLAEMGLDAEWYCIPASALGAPHPRERLWIVAYTNEFRRHSAPFGYDSLRQFERASSSAFRIPEPPEPPVCGVDDGIPDRVDRLFALGNTVVPQIPELIGRAILASEAA
jgi:DNA (cytosine-5)-methyltransferase 1